MTSNYPEYPNYSSEPQLADPARPKPVESSFMLWVANAALGLVVFIISLAFGRDAAREQVVDSLRRQGQEITDANIDAAITVGLVVAGIIAAVFFGLYLLFAFKMRAGRNWARIVLAVLGGIALILNILSLAGGGNAIALIFTLLQIALIGGAIYFMFTKEANNYFDAAKRA